MKKLAFVIGAAAIILGLASPSGVLAGTERMTTEELTALISGTTVYGTSSQGKKFIQVFGEDGSLESGNTGRKDSDGKWKPYEYGSWKVKDGKLCNSYTKPKKRSGGCDKFYKTDDGKYVYTTRSGGRGSFDKIVVGRPE